MVALGSRELHGVQNRSSADVMGMTTELTVERSGCFRSRARFAFREHWSAPPSGARPQDRNGRSYRV